MAHNSNFR